MGIVDANSRVRVSPDTQSGCLPSDTQCSVSQTEAMGGGHSKASMETEEPVPNVWNRFKKNVTLKMMGDRIVMTRKRLRDSFRGQVRRYEARRQRRNQTGANLVLNRVM